MDNFLNIKINDENFAAKRGENLLYFLREKGFNIAADCAGNGTCKKCTVLVGNKPVQSCRYSVTHDILVEIIDNTQFKIETDYKRSCGNILVLQRGYGVAVDIGTTTVAVELINLQNGKTVAKTGFVNPQRPFGADVISRINSADSGNLNAMRRLICDFLKREIQSLIIQNKINPPDISQMVIAGNATMIYILLGLDCHSLGVSPFTANAGLSSPYRFVDLFGAGDICCDVFIVPWICAFIGGDIVCGLITAAIQNSEDKPFLLVDLGTNGEIVLYSNGEFLCTSTAAGPAFEGGNISRGTAGISGAVCSVQYKEDAFIVETIGGTAPIGICGSGILDIAARLFENKIIDESGLLIDDYFDGGVPICGDIIITQKDIREIQLAKSAIRAGIEILIKSAGTINIEKVFLCGGFGKELSAKSAFSIGIFQDSLKGFIEPLGNSSLAGAAALIKNPNLWDKVKDILNSSKEINLAAHPDFNNNFIEYMGF